MKSIPNTFTKFGDRFVLMEHDEENRLLIYERTNRAGVIRYELMRYRRATTANPAFRIEIGDYLLPGAEQWGIYGWTFISFDNAHKKMQELQSTRKVKA